MVVHVVGVLLVLLSPFTTSHAQIVEDRRDEDVTSVSNDDTVSYDEVKAGTCTSVSKAHCQKIAAQLGKSFSQFDKVGFPPGCYNMKKKVWYNNAAHSKASCQARRTCLCQRARTPAIAPATPAGLKESDLAELEQRIKTDIGKVIAEKIGSVEQRVSTRLQNVQNGIESRIETVKSNLSSNVQDLNNRVETALEKGLTKSKLAEFEQRIETDIEKDLAEKIGSIPKNISSEVEGLSNQVAALEEGLSYTPFYVGRGKPANRDGTKVKSRVSLTGCIGWCADLHRTKGAEWNGVTYYASTTFCHCYHNATGFNESKRYVYYRFL